MNLIKIIWRTVIFFLGISVFWSVPKYDSIWLKIGLILIGLGILYTLYLDIKGKIRDYRPVRNDYKYHKLIEHYCGDYLSVEQQDNLIDDILNLYKEEEKS